MNYWTVEKYLKDKLKTNSAGNPVQFEICIGGDWAHADLYDSSDLPPLKVFRGWYIYTSMIIRDVDRQQITHVLYIRKMDYRVKGKKIIR